MLMAVSGVVFVVFVLVHMYGNLKAFSGHDAFNEYAAAPAHPSASRSCPHEGMLWAIRAVLLGVPRRPRDLRGRSLWRAGRAGPDHALRR